MSQSLLHTGTPSAVYSIGLRWIETQKFFFSERFHLCKTDQFTYDPLLHQAYLAEEGASSILMDKGEEKNAEARKT